MDAVEVRSVAVVGDENAVAAARRAGVTATATGADGADGVDAVVAVGTDALSAVAHRSPPAPVLAVEAGAGVCSVPRDRLEDALESLGAGDWRVSDRALLSVDGTTRAAFEASLVAAPTHISEYAIDTGVSETAVDIADVRADGVVVATPAGSARYAHAAGGPLVAPGIDAAAVVPVGPYAVGRDQWVLDLPVRVTVTRDESAVSLFADGRECGRVDPHDTVVVDRGDTLGLATVPESAQFPDDS
jgi:NAD+ kinase